MDFPLLLRRRIPDAGLVALSLRESPGRARSGGGGSFRISGPFLFRGSGWNLACRTSGLGSSTLPLELLGLGPLGFGSVSGFRGG